MRSQKKIFLTILLWTMMLGPALADQSSAIEAAVIIMYLVGIVVVLLILFIAFSLLSLLTLGNKRLAAIITVVLAIAGFFQFKEYLPDF